METNCQTRIGDYAKVASFDTFISQRNAGGPRNDIARLVSARFVSAIEVAEGRHLDEAVIKLATGGDTVTARFLYQEAFQFRPQFKLVLVANDPPEVRGHDTAIKRRIVPIPFIHAVPEDKVDTSLKGYLKNDPDARSAILAWAVRGWQDYKTNGLALPPVVTKAAESYFKSNDPVGDFVEACCALKTNAWTAGGKLYRAYELWAESSGDAPIERKRFINYLVQWEGLARKRVRDRGVSGIELNKDAPKDPM